ncbi:MAG: multiple sugar transport system permease protein [Thermoleophilaceae bacterium]|jgi:ABC-type glycerol-3-phosphate transport system permease component|nr:multiple sugar transport system permease protein [Thermoleophilaceae bacterium]MEA2402527.1 multiple sugar transport system permease protein [Thermoleophilaceae bacterium]MEA2455175.1 multiple sugar transport system permease protein [Thermoleophilaceae bacterium]
MTRGARVVGRAAVWLWILAAMVPFVFILVTSIKPGSIAISVPPEWSFTPTLQNYSDILSGNTASSEAFAPLVWHSAIVSLSSTALAVAVGLPAAYALTMSRFRPRRALSSWILSTIMFPPIVAVVPVFILAGKLQLTDTYPVLVIPYAAFNLPMVIWVLRSTINQIPREVEQAALVDGATRTGVLLRVILPLVMPGVATAAILSIVLSWNEFLFALTLTREHVKTAPVGVAEFTGLFGTQYGYLTAASVVIVAPILVLVMILRRRFVSGLTFGAVK